MEKEKDKKEKKTVTPKKTANKKAVEKKAQETKKNIRKKVEQASAFHREQGTLADNEKLIKDFSDIEHQINALYLLADKEDSHNLLKGSLHALNTKIKKMKTTASDNLKNIEKVKDDPIIQDSFENVETNDDTTQKKQADKESVNNLNQFTRTELKRFARLTGLEKDFDIVEQTLEQLQKAVDGVKTNGDTVDKEKFNNDKNGAIDTLNGLKDFLKESTLTNDDNEMFGNYIEKLKTDYSNLEIDSTEERINDCFSKLDKDIAMSAETADKAIDGFTAKTRGENQKLFEQQSALLDDQLAHMQEVLESADELITDDTKQRYYELYQDRVRQIEGLKNQYKRLSKEADKSAKGILESLDEASDAFLDKIHKISSVVSALQLTGALDGLKGSIDKQVNTRYFMEQRANSKERAEVYQKKSLDGIRKEVQKFGGKLNYGDTVDEMVSVYNRGYRNPDDLKNVVMNRNLMEKTLGVNASQYEGLEDSAWRNGWSDRYIRSINDTILDLQAGFETDIPRLLDIVEKNADQISMVSFDERTAKKITASIMKAEAVTDDYSFMGSGVMDALLESQRTGQNQLINSLGLQQQTDALMNAGKMEEANGLVLSTMIDRLGKSANITEDDWQVNDDGTKILKASANRRINTMAKDVYGLNDFDFASAIKLGQDNGWNKDNIFKGYMDNVAKADAMEFNQTIEDPAKESVAENNVKENLHVPLDELIMNKIGASEFGAKVADTLGDIGVDVGSILTVVSMFSGLKGLGGVLSTFGKGLKLGGAGKVLTKLFGGKGLGNLVGAMGKGGALTKATSALGKASGTLGETASAVSKGSGVLGQAGRAVAGSADDVAGGLFKGVSGGLGKGLGLVGKGLSKAVVPVALGVEAVSGGIKATQKFKEGDTVGGVGEISGSVGSIGGGIGGAKLGALIGTAICPGLGTAIGGAVGAIAGGIAGSILGKKGGEVIAENITKADPVDEIDTDIMSKSIPPMDIKSRAGMPSEVANIIDNKKNSLINGSSDTSSKRNVLSDTEYTAGYGNNGSMYNANYNSAIADNLAETENIYNKYNDNFMTESGKDITVPTYKANKDTIGNKASEIIQVLRWGFEFIGKKIEDTNKKAEVVPAYASGRTDFSSSDAFAVGGTLA